MTPPPIELIGCGALGEQVYAPLLASFEKAGRVRVAALVDVDAGRRARLQRLFPTAQLFAQVEELPPTSYGLAIVATPPAVHAAQTIALLAAGRHVLCEKPLATSMNEAEKMVTAARAANRLLAAGMMRRFYPAAQALREIIAGKLLGEIQRVEIADGGRFSWNAASPKFFARAQGGVLFDLGSHVLDLLCHIFGEPAVTTTFTDALGGTNTNALLEARWPSGLEARVRLSWDTPIETGWRITATNGELRWDGSPDGPLEIRLCHGHWHLVARPVQASFSGAPAGWNGAFVRQLENVLGAIGARNTLLAPAEDVLPSLRWLETALYGAHPLPQPWLSPEEQTTAARLAAT